jgi:hypothetical protein
LKNYVLFHIHKKILSLVVKLAGTDNKTRETCL